MLTTQIKQPAEKLDYDIDFSKWLPADDKVVSATTELDVSGQLSIDSTQINTPVVKIWVSGGVSGSTYKVTITVTTEAGRIKQEEFKIRVRDY